MFILAQNLMFAKLRFLIESFSVILKIFVTFFCVKYFDLGLLSFSFGQIAYSLSLFVSYYSYFIYRMRSGGFGEHNLTSLSDLFPNLKFFNEISQKFRVLFVFWLQVKILFLFLFLFFNFLIV